eukprot:2080435-Rhodomonas_salina.1
MEALTQNADGHKWNVGASGLFEAWKWHGVAGESIPDGALQFATDASKKGSGIVYEDERRTLVWRSQEQSLHINVLEALMVLDWCTEFGPSARGKRVLAWCDNTTTVAAINKGTSRSNLIAGIVRRIRLCAARSGPLISQERSTSSPTLCLEDSSRRVSTTVASSEGATIAGIARQAALRSRRSVARAAIPLGAPTSAP